MPSIQGPVLCVTQEGTTRTLQCRDLFPDCFVEGGEPEQAQRSDLDVAGAISTHHSSVVTLLRRLIHDLCDGSEPIVGCGATEAAETTALLRHPASVLKPPLTSWRSGMPSALINRCDGLAGSNAGSDRDAKCGRGGR
jgi:hypothetical protein